MTCHCTTLALIAAALVLPLTAAAADTAKPSATAAKAARNERQCPMPSNPRLQKKGECAQATERTRWYSRSDLESTGQFNTADALRQLDPSFR